MIIKLQTEIAEDTLRSDINGRLSDAIHEIYQDLEADDYGFERGLELCKESSIILNKIIREEVLKTLDILEEVE